ncbi:MAG: universal stress protein [Opitutaceae bacterium]|nr:universal stress protein [Cytophagales bacterium]
MITVLVPNDYSSNADHALRFAMQLASEKPVRLVVFQVGEILIPTSTPYDLYKELYPEKLKGKVQDLRNHVNKMIHGYELPLLHFEYDWADNSNFQEALEKATGKHKPDLIVMGTKGANGIAKVLIGSNTVNSIEKSKVPILAIPQNVNLHFIKSVSYASDLREIKSEMKVLVKFANHFDWAIRIFHVLPNYPEWVDPSKENIEYIISELKESYPDQPFSIELIPTKEENDIIKGLEIYVEKFKPDVLVMFPSELTFLDKLLQTSKTEEMAFHSTVPLLVIRH